MNKLNDHFTFEQFADFIDGRLPLPDAARVEAHLGQGCAPCQREIDWLRETTAVMAEEWPAPPKAVRANVQRAFRYYVPASRQQETERANLPAIPWFHRLFKSKLRWVTAVTAVLVLLLLSGSYYRSWAQEVVLHSASVVQLEGPVEILRAGTDTWQPLDSMSQISAGDSVRTGPDAQLGLRFFSNNVTYLSPDTQLKIVALSIRRDGEERVITLNLAAGQLYSSGWPPDTEMTRLAIQTPQAVVAVQAQGYDVLINTSEGTEISVVKGCAEIVSYDAATKTSYRHQTGTACGRETPPVQDAPVAPVFEL